VIESFSVEIVTKVLPAILSWPVAAIVVAMLFRKPLVGLLDKGTNNIKKIKISELEVEFVDTALGKINQSPTAVNFPINNIAFENKNLGFRISYPVQSQVQNVSLSPVYDQQSVSDAFGGGPVYFILRWEKVKSESSFCPSINVMVGPLGTTIIEKTYIIKNLTIEETTNFEKYNAKQMDELLKVKARNVSFNIDKKNNSGVYEFDMKYEYEIASEATKKYRDCHHVSRNILSNGLAYVSTATWEKAETDQSLIAEMNKILNSFTVLPARGVNPES